MLSSWWSRICWEPRVLTQEGFHESILQNYSHGTIKIEHISSFQGGPWSISVCQASCMMNLDPDRRWTVNGREGFAACTFHSFTFLQGVARLPWVIWLSCYHQHAGGQHGCFSGLPVPKPRSRRVRRIENLETLVCVASIQQMRRANMRCKWRHWNRACNHGLFKWIGVCEISAKKYLKNARVRVILKKKLW